MRALATSALRTARRGTSPRRRRQRNSSLAGCPHRRVAVALTVGASVALASTPLRSPALRGRAALVGGRQSFATPATRTDDPVRRPLPKAPAGFRLGPQRERQCAWLADHSLSSFFDVCARDFA